MSEEMYMPRGYGHFTAEVAKLFEVKDRVIQGGGEVMVRRAESLSGNPPQVERTDLEKIILQESDDDEDCDCDDDDEEDYE